MKDQIEFDSQKPAGAGAGDENKQQIAHEFQKYDLPAAMRRLFQFIEVESNIGMDKIESSTYKMLKARLNELVNEKCLNDSSILQTPNRKSTSGKKR